MDIPSVIERVMHIPGVMETIKKVGTKSVSRELLITANYKRLELKWVLVVFLIRVIIARRQATYNF